MYHYSNPLRGAVRAAGPSNPFQRLLMGLSPQQRAYVLCPEGIHTNHAARRAGKSRANAVKLLRKAATCPGGFAFFAAKDAKTAKRIIWKTFHELNEEYGLGLKFHRGDLIVECPNGYSIWLLGLSDEGEADKLRGGTHGFDVGVIDECSTINDEVLQYAAIACALPALGENGGLLTLSGTPGTLMQGFFYEQCHSRVNFHWDARDNPYLKRGGLRMLEEALRNNPGWTWDHPTFKREFLGIWCEDRDALIYDYLAARNLIYDAFPAGRTVLGVDVGFEDGNGFCVSRTEPPNNPEIHILRCYERQHQKLPALAAEIESLRRHYHVNHIFIDEGNNGLMVSKTLQEMGIPCLPGPKGLKRPRIEVVRGGLSSGVIKVLRGQCDTLVGEFGMLPWNEKYTDADDRYSNECTDACINAVLPQTFAYHHLLDGPKPGSAEAARRAQEDDKEREERESITRADLDKISAHINQVRARSQQLLKPEPSAVADAMAWRR